MQTVLKAVIELKKVYDIDVIAEGVETQKEMDWLRNAGIQLMQGYFFAKPGFEHLPEVDLTII